MLLLVSSGCTFPFEERDECLDSVSSEAALIEEFPCDDKAAAAFHWTNPPVGGELGPSSPIKWNTTGLAAQEVDVFLESADAARPICIRVVAECKLPSELPAASSFSWWIRASDDRGTIRSPDFSFQTPTLDLRITSVTIPSHGLHGHGRLDWVTGGAEPAREFALLAPEGRSVHVLCQGGPPCATGQPLDPAVAYDAEIRAYAGSGLFVQHRLEGLAVNHPPTAAFPVNPAVGQEVQAGEILIRWDSGSDPEGDQVTFRVETKNTGTGTWIAEHVGSTPQATVHVSAGESVVWRVLSRDAAGNDVASPYFHFRARDSPPSALPSSPIRGSVVPPLAPVEFSWVSQSSRMGTVQLSRENDTWVDACSGRTSCTYRGELRAGSKYDWRVVEGDTATEPAIEEFETVEPVVLLHGLLGNGDVWETAIQHLEASGFYVLDFDPNDLGTQALTVQPTNSAQGIQELSTAVVAPKVRQALHAAGFIDGVEVLVVAHSLGGLVARVLSTQGSTAGFSIAGLATLGTPHQGSAWVPLWKATDLLLPLVLGYFGVGHLHGVVQQLVDFGLDPWQRAIDDLAPGSAFLASLNAKPPAVDYVAIAGSRDLVVGVSRATYGAVESFVVDLGHTTLTGKACHAREGMCEIGMDALSLVLDWLENDAHSPIH